jgi:hypothetical protein
VNDGASDVVLPEEGTLIRKEHLCWRNYLSALGESGNGCCRKGCLEKGPSPLLETTFVMQDVLAAVAVGHVA